MGENANQMESVSFTCMADGTAREYAFLTLLYEKCHNGVSDRLMELLKAMKGDKLGYVFNHGYTLGEDLDFCLGRMAF